MLTMFLCKRDGKVPYRGIRSIMSATIEIPTNIKAAVTVKVVKLIILSKL